MSEVQSKKTYILKPNAGYGGMHTKFRGGGMTKNAEP
jgi:hypothetical protein